VDGGVRNDSAGWLGYETDYGRSALLRGSFMRNGKEKKWKYECDSE
jgi:hypothetical protein